MQYLKYIPLLPFGLRNTIIDALTRIRGYPIKIERYPDRLDHLGRPKMLEKHTVEYPTYLTELDRIWQRVHGVLDRHQMCELLTGVEDVYLIEDYRGRPAVYLVELFFSWGTLFLEFGASATDGAYVRMRVVGHGVIDQGEAHECVWALCDALDRMVPYEKLVPRKPKPAEQAAEEPAYEGCGFMPKAEKERAAA